jgi:type IV secretion system protein VirB3
MRTTDSGDGLTADVLFVAATRPPTRWGVPFMAMLLNMVLTMEVFLATRNPLTILIGLPIHGVSALLCARDVRFFELLLLWAQTRMLGYLGNVRAWKGNSHSHLSYDLPDINGRRRLEPVVRV